MVDGEWCRIGPGEDAGFGVGAGAAADGNGSSAAVGGHSWLDYLLFPSQLSQVKSRVLCMFWTWDVKLLVPGLLGLNMFVTGIFWLPSL